MYSKLVYYYLYFPALGKKRENEELAGFLLKVVTEKLHIFLTPLSCWLKLDHIVIPSYLVHLSCSNKIP